jgi:hypothetical protein
MNRLLLTGIVVLLWAVIGCSNKDRVPGGVLSKEKMRAVLWDIIQAERFTATYVAKDSSKNIKVENFKLYSQIFSIHDVTKDEFIKSYNFYLSRPDMARMIFDSLAARANRQREEMYKSQKPAADSGKTVRSGLSPDSMHARLRDSLTKSNRQKLLNSSKTNPPVIKPDSVKPNQPKRLPRPRLFKSDSVKSTQPKRLLRPAGGPAGLRIRDSLIRRQ